VLDGEEHIEPLEEHGVHAEEVRGQDALSLGPEELGPGRASTRGAGPRPWRRSTRRTDVAPTRMPSLAELALDTHTAPAAVLPAQAHDQLDQLPAHGWAARASLASPRSPLAPSGFSVPTEQRPGRDEEGSPPFPRKEPAEGGQEGAVDGAVPDSAMELALKNTHLVAEDNKLDVLVYFAAPA
jgi:hypothetical protein